MWAGKGKHCLEALQALLALEKMVEVLRVRARGVDSVQQGATADQKAESCWSVPLPCRRAHRSLSS